MTEILLNESRPGDVLRDSYFEKFPEIAAMVNCPQDPEWHPEGDVFTHVCHVLNAFARERTGDGDLIVGLGCLCHDLGKPATTLMEEGRWRSRGHPEEGITPTATLLVKLGYSTSVFNKVISLVRYHHLPYDLYKARSSGRAIRRLARKVRLDHLCRVSKADINGRPPLPYLDHDPASEWILRRAAEFKMIENNEVAPIIMGRHLLPLGYTPGPELGGALKKCLDAQIAGMFSNLEEGLALLTKIVKTDKN